MISPSSNRLCEHIGFDAYDPYKTLTQTPTLLTLNLHHHHSFCFLDAVPDSSLSSKGRVSVSCRWTWCSVDWSTAVSLRPPYGTAWPRVGGENVACHCYSAYTGLSERWRWWLSIRGLCRFLILSSPAFICMTSEEKYY